MERTPVSSSNIVSIGYDSDTMTLEIEFKGGSVYQYQGVPEAEFVTFMAAPSKGQHFHAHIKDRFPTLKL